MYHLKDEQSEFNTPEALSSIVKRLGNPISTALLHLSCQIFKTPQIDGVIGYQRSGKVAVVIGDPVCLPKDTAALINAFHHYCRQNHWKTVYLSASHDFAHFAINNECKTSVQFGSVVSVDPSTFKKKQKLRWKINQSIQHGVHVKEYKGFDPLLENKIKHCIDTWLEQRRGPQIHLGGINFSNNNEERRIFYAEQNGNVIGFLMLHPLDRFQGWVVCSYLAIQGSPVGTTENLMCTCFDALAAENCHYLCLGIAVGGELGEIVGLNAFGKKVARLIFNGARRFFKLDAKGHYFHKFHPDFHPTFLVFRDKISISELLAIKNVLNVKL